MMQHSSHRYWKTALWCFFFFNQAATAISFNRRKLIHHSHKHCSYFSLGASPPLISFLLTPTSSPSLYPLSAFSFSQVVPTKSTIQPPKSSSFISISGRFPVFTEGGMNRKVIGSELKWNRLFRLRCVLPRNVRWMRKYCKAESAADEGRGGLCVVYARCGGWQIEGDTVKHQQWFGCNLYFFIHLSLCFSSDSQSSGGSAAKCQELELKGSLSHFTRNTSWWVIRWTEWCYQYGTMGWDFLQGKSKQNKVKVSRGWASFTIHVKLICFLTNLRTWVDFF